MPVPAASAARLLLLFFLALPDAAVALEPEPTRVGRISAVEGDARISYGEDAEAAEAATVNYPVTAGARIFMAPGARAEVRIGSSALRLNGQAILDVVTLEERLAQFGLDEGSVNLALRDVYGYERFEIAVPGATITIRAAGSYRIDADPAAESIRIAVRAGEALITSDAGENLIRSGRSVSISGAGHVEYETATARDLDDFDRWSQALEGAPGDTYTGYVPEAVTGYEELDQHGTWSTYSGYGSVWTPGAAYDWWTPYSYGRWAWVPNWGWAWVDQAPWAFATFRFGRWVFLDDRWWWAPGAFWPRPALAAYVPFYPGQIIFTTSHFVHGKPARHFVPLKPGHVVTIRRPWHRHGWRSTGRHVDRQHAARFAGPAPGTPAIAAIPVPQAVPGTAASRDMDSGSSMQRGVRRLPPGIVSPLNRRPRPGIVGTVAAPAGVGSGTAAATGAGLPAPPVPRGATPDEPAPRTFQPETRRGHLGELTNPGLSRSRLREPASSGPESSRATRTEVGAPNEWRHRIRDGHPSIGAERERPRLPNAVIFQGVAPPPAGSGGGAARQTDGSARGGGEWRGGRRSRESSSVGTNPGRALTGYRRGGGNTR